MRALLVDVGGVLVAQAVWDGLPENAARRALQLARLHDAFGEERPWFRSVCVADYGSTQPPTWEQPTRSVFERLLSDHQTDLTDGDMWRICSALAVPMAEFATLEHGDCFLSSLGEEGEGVWSEQAHVVFTEGRLTPSEIFGRGEGNNLLH